MHVDYTSSHLKDDFEVSLIKINFAFRFIFCQTKVAALRPLPQLPVGRVAVEGKKRSRRSTESKKADVTVTSESVSPQDNGVLPLPQVRVSPKSHSNVNF